jgi:hypothetical protein
MIYNNFEQNIKMNVSPKRRLKHKTTVRRKRMIVSRNNNYSSKQIKLQSHNKQILHRTSCTNSDRMMCAACDCTHALLHQDVVRSRHTLIFCLKRNKIRNRQRTTNKQ